MNKNAKYRVRNERGEYDVVHFETNMAQGTGLNAALGEKAVASEVNSKVEEVNNAIDAVEATAGSLGGRLGKAESKANANEAAIQAEKERAEGIEQGVDTRLGAAEQQLEEITGEGGLSKLQESVRQNTEGLAAEIARATAAEQDLTGKVAKKVEQSDFAAETLRVNKALADKAADSDLKAAIQENELALEKKANTSDVARDIAANLVTAKAYADSKRDEAKAHAQQLVQTLTQTVNGIDERVTTNHDDIEEIKRNISSKNSNTLVYETMEEFTQAAGSLKPKKGDLAFVIDVKKAFIYKEEAAPVVMYGGVAAPEGWVLFDEITTQLDLKEYAKTVEVERQINDLDGKVEAETRRATAKEQDIDSKADRAGSDLAAETLARKSAVSGVEAKITSKEQEINTKIENNAPSIGGVQPVGKAQNHIWIDFN